MKRITNLIIAFSVSFSAFGQEMELDLYNFRLGQYRGVAKNEFPQLLQQERFDDGFEYEVYAVEKDTSVYIVFEYAPHDSLMIWSIQITGYKEGFDCGFKGLKIGMDKNAIIKTLGAPSSKSDAGEYGERWNYGINYSLEITKEDKLAGVKIADETNYDMKERKAVPPDFEEFYPILKSKDRNELSKILAPSIEVYKDKKIYSFQRPFNIELKSDASEVYNRLNELANILSTVDPSDTLQYDVNLRVVYGYPTNWVSKIYKDDKYYEIVFKYLLNQYLIWEVKLD